MLGWQLGMTASVLTYSYLSSSAGFKLYPFAPAKVQGYTKIGGAFLFFYIVGSGYVTSKFGDARPQRYLFWNKSKILSGAKGWDRTD